MLQLLLYFEKNCEIIFFRRLTSVSEKTPKIISIGPLIMEKRSFKKLKILSILAGFISKIKKLDIFNFRSTRYFAKCFLFLKIWNIRFKYCGNQSQSPAYLFASNLDPRASCRYKRKAKNFLKKFLWGRGWEPGRFCWKKYYHFNL